MQGIPNFEVRIFEKYKSQKNKNNSLKSEWTFQQSAAPLLSNLGEELKFAISQHASKSNMTEYGSRLEIRLPLGTYRIFKVICINQKNKPAPKRKLIHCTELIE